MASNPAYSPTVAVVLYSSSESGRGESEMEEGRLVLVIMLIRLRLRSESIAKLIAICFNLLLLSYCHTLASVRILNRCVDFNDHAKIFCYFLKRRTQSFPPFFWGGGGGGREVAFLAIYQMPTPMSDT
eukprot:jgi/Botrbrau1/818/Bobra.0352s0015.1